MLKKVFIDDIDQIELLLAHAIRRGLWVLIWSMVWVLLRYLRWQCIFLTGA